jgi:hypothetical protein
VGVDLQPEVESELVLAQKSLVVPAVELGQDKHQGRLLCQRDTELLVVLRLPRHLDADPALAASPVGLPEQAGSIPVQVLAQEIGVADPEARIAAELMSELLFDVAGPLLGSVAPGTLPDALLELAPGVSSSGTIRLEIPGRTAGILTAA